MAISWDVPIEMDDGLVLRCDVYKPPEEGEYPVILSYGPYAKNLSFQMGYPGQWKAMCDEHPDVPANSSNKYQSWEVVDPDKWTRDGYACVRVDSRGAGRSPGKIDCFSPRETQDFYECIEWAGVQPWSNGKVGLNGISYYGMNQWQVATKQPPHLAAMCIWEGAADWYRDATHHGGILSTFWDRWYPHQVTNVQHGLGENGRVNEFNGMSVTGDETLSEEELAENLGDFGEDIYAQPLDNEYHRERSPQWDKVKTPLLTAASQIASIDGMTDKEDTLAYLPMAWVGDQIYSMGEGHVTGFCVNCPESSDTVMLDLKDIGPTAFFSPPAIFEGFITQIQIRMEDASNIKRRMYRYFMDIAGRVGVDMLEGRHVSGKDKLLYRLGEYMVYGPLKNNLGLSRVKVAYTGGAPLGEEVFNFYRSIGINLKQLYGQTESSAYVTLQRDGDVKLDTVGPPCPEVEVRIEEGEIQIKTPGVFLGYFKNQEATDEALPHDGWFKTGDAARQDEDGYYYIVDRWKDMFISGGENVYPVEVENVIYQLDGVLETAVVGIADDKWGEVGRAFVVLKTGANLDEEAITGHCKGRLAAFKVPKEVRFIEELPHNATGKVLKHELPRS